MKDSDSDIDTDTLFSTTDRDFLHTFVTSHNLTRKTDLS